jgi:hypothetical protein
MNDNATPVWVLNTEGVDWAALLFPQAGVL